MAERELYALLEDADAWADSFKTMKDDPNWSAKYNKDTHWAHIHGYRHWHRRATALRSELYERSPAFRHAWSFWDRKNQKKLQKAAKEKRYQEDYQKRMQTEADYRNASEIQPMDYLIAAMEREERTPSIRSPTKATRKQFKSPIKQSRPKPYITFKKSSITPAQRTLINRNRAIAKRRLRQNMSQRSIRPKTHIVYIPFRKPINKI